MHRRQRLGAVVFIAAVAAAPVLLWCGSAYAATATYNDPRPCTASIDQGICISSVRVADTGSTITLSMTVGRVTDPATDANWMSERSAIVWDLYVNGASQRSYSTHAGDVTVTNTTVLRDAFLGVVGRDILAPGLGGYGVTCDWQSGVAVQTDVGTNTYTIAFPASCIGSPSSVAAEAEWTYDTSGGSADLSRGNAGPIGPIVVFEASPADGPCCVVAPHGGTAPTTTRAASEATNVVPPTSVNTQPVAVSPVAKASSSQPRTRFRPIATNGTWTSRGTDEMLAALASLLVLLAGVAAVRYRRRPGISWRRR